MRRAPTEEQLVRDLGNKGIPLDILCAEHNISRATAYRRRKQVRSWIEAKVPYADMSFPKPGRPKRISPEIQKKLRRLLREYDRTLISRWEANRAGKSGHPKGPRPAPKLGDLLRYIKAAELDCGKATVRKALAELKISTDRQRRFRRGLKRRKAQ